MLADGSRRLRRAVSGLSALALFGAAWSWGERAEANGFGSSGGFRIGPALLHRSPAAPTGLAYEFHLDGHYVFGGDSFAAGVSLGYLSIDGGDATVRPRTDYSFGGTTLAATFMMSLTPGLFVSLRPGLLFGSARYGRLGGGLTYVAVRHRILDLGLALNADHFLPASPEAKDSFTTVTLGVVVSFFPGI